MMPSRVGTSAFEFGRAFLILGDDAGNLLQSVDEVHAGGMGVRHGDIAVVELVFVVAFDNESVLDFLFCRQQGHVLR